MNMLSPNELERLRMEEVKRRRVQRLQEVREYSRRHATKLRDTYKDQKRRVIDRIAMNFQEQLCQENAQELKKLENKYSIQQQCLGEAHKKAGQWIDPSDEVSQQAALAEVVAHKRHREALQQRLEQKERQESVRKARLEAMRVALEVEKERAAAVADLPPIGLAPYEISSSEDSQPRVKLCEQTQHSLLESYRQPSYLVEPGLEEQRLGGDHSVAEEAAILRQHFLEQLHTHTEIQTQEHAIKADLRGHKALRKQMVQKDYVQLLQELEQVAKCEMATRQRDYLRTELLNNNNSGGIVSGACGGLGISSGHNAAKQIFKERCRERAVENAVMSSLKDITNKPEQPKDIKPQEIYAEPTSDADDEEIENVKESKIQHDSKLNRLYEKIKRQQHQNVAVASAEEDKSSCPEAKAVGSKTTHPKEITEPVKDASRSSKNDVFISQAMLASTKTDLALKHANMNRQRLHLEEAAEALDVRMDLMNRQEHVLQTHKGNSSCRSRDSSRETLTDNRNDAEAQQQPDEWLGSGDLARVRQFQRQALLKLAGQVNISDILSMQQCLASLSTSTETSIGETRYQIESSQFSSSNHKLAGAVASSHVSSVSRSSVSDWLSRQQPQLDELPDWVTRQLVEGGPAAQSLASMSSSCDSLARPVNQSSLTEVTRLRQQLLLSGNCSDLSNSSGTPVATLALPADAATDGDLINLSSGEVSIADQNRNQNLCDSIEVIQETDLQSSQILIDLDNGLTTTDNTTNIPQDNLEDRIIKDDTTGLGAFKMAEYREFLATLSNKLSSIDYTDSPMRVEEPEEDTEAAADANTTAPEASDDNLLMPPFTAHSSITCASSSDSLFCGTGCNQFTHDKSNSGPQTSTMVPGRANLLTDLHMSLILVTDEVSDSRAIADLIAPIDELSNDVLDNICHGNGYISNGSQGDDEASNHSCHEDIISSNPNFQDEYVPEFLRQNQEAVAAREEQIQSLSRFPGNEGTIRQPLMSTVLPGRFCAEFRAPANLTIIDELSLRYLAQADHGRCRNADYHENQELQSQLNVPASSSAIVDQLSTTTDNSPATNIGIDQSKPELE